jgi:hypothetical protein
MRAVRRKLVVLLVLLTSPFVVTATPAHAAPHGCVSGTNSYWVSADLARRSLMAAVSTNKQCSFYYSPGDTWSGSGAFVIRCSTGGKVNHPDVQGGQYPPVLNEPIPQPCKKGATVTIHANQPFQGGAVVAGSPA